MWMAFNDWNPMTQILVHRAAQGIVLATDSRAVAFSDTCDDESEHFTVSKVFHPLPNVVLVTGGAGHGQWLCENLAAYLVEQGLNDAVHAAEVALPLLGALLKTMRKQRLACIDLPHLERFYVVVAGIHHSEDNPPSVDVRLFASEDASDPLHAVQVDRVVTIPRQLTLEYRLTRKDNEELSLDAVEVLFERFLANAAQAYEDVGPPFHFIRIQPTGIQWRTSAVESMSGNS